MSKLINSIYICVILIRWFQRIEQRKTLHFRTSRERPQPAPYFRLKNSKRYQVFSSTVPEWGKKFSKNVLKSPVSRIVPKIVKKATLWNFLYCCKILKIERGTLFDIKKICEKKTREAKITCTKNFLSRAGLEPKRLFARQTSNKALLTSMPSASRSSVAVSVSASQLIKLIKSVTSLVFKKSLL